MATKVELEKYFPCATAPIVGNDMSHRLWTEYNITNIFNFLFDYDDSKPILNYNATKMVIKGYMFEAQSGSTFQTSTSYWIKMTSDGELLSDPQNEYAVLYQGDKPTVESDQSVFGGAPQYLKFTQSSLDNINLNRTVN